MREQELNYILQQLIEKSSKMLVVTRGATQDAVWLDHQKFAAKLSTLLKDQAILDELKANNHLLQMVGKWQRVCQELLASLVIQKREAFKELQHIDTIEKYGEKQMHKSLRSLTKA